MAICLVPHVYRQENDSQDLKLLRKLRDELNSPRVSIVEENYTCEELKYIISRCRFFIGARTHSTIAAYSTGVPCLVIGYSVKSKGIATDLFGTYRDFVLPYDEQTEANELLAAFRKLMENEERIKDNYRKVLPDYKKQLTDAIEKYIPRYEKIGNLRCTGCSACAPRAAYRCRETKKDFSIRRSTRADAYTAMPVIKPALSIKNMELPAKRKLIAGKVQTTGSEI